VDANVLIDFCTADLTPLALVSRHLRPVRILTPVLGEVQQMDAPECDRHGLELWEPSLEQLLAAGVRRRSLSFLDHLCLIVARDEGWVCATNDKVLRQQCQAEGVPTRWGLELLVDLVEAKHLARATAISIATEIHTNNRLHITATILARFEQRLRTPHG
jgi:rRNA-processing protein FCF1